MRKLIFLLIFAFSFISPVKAQNCKVLPTCEELGYNKTVSQCAGIEYLTCPFDETKVYCPSTDPCDDYEDKTCTYGCASYYSDCPSKCKTCNTPPADPCAGYYECGGPWQYCTGYTCSADSTKCSVYCEDDYFPNQCSSSSYCYGVYRNGYCSGSCNEPSSDPCDSYTSQTCDYGCQETYSDCTSKCKTCYSDNCHNRTSQSCTYGCKETYSDCSSKCKTCYSDNCHNRTNKTCGLYDCASHYQDCSTKCETCCAASDGWTSCPEGANCSSSVCGYIVTSCNTGYRKVFNDIIGLDTCYIL